MKVFRFQYLSVAHLKSKKIFPDFDSDSLKKTADDDDDVDDDKEKCL